MNLLESIMRILSFQDWKESSSLPGWANRSSRMRHSRTPFSSSRKYHIARSNMRTEAFQDKEKRDERFTALRKAKTPNLTKYSTAHESGSTWYVVHT